MRRVVVTGLGAVTPIGNDARATWHAALAGESGVDFIRAFDPSEYPVRIAAEVKDFDPTGVASPKEVRKLERNVLLALAAAREAVGDAELDGAYDPGRIGILFGTAIGGFLGMMEQHDILRERGPTRVSPTFIPSVLADAASGQLAISLGYRGPNYAPVSACATGSHAVGEAAEVIRRGDADAVLAGGAEACMHPLILAGFCSMRGLVAEDEYPPNALRPFDATRAGFVMGEGACVLVLEELEAAQKRGATIYAEILGYGASNDAHHMAQPDPEFVGVSEMMRSALAPRGHRAGAGRLHQRARHLDAAGGPCRDERDQGGLRRARVQPRRLLDEVRHRPLLRRRRRDRGDDVRTRDSRGRAPADDQLPASRSGVRPRLRSEREARDEGRYRAFERDGPRRPQRLRARRTRRVTDPELYAEEHSTPPDDVFARIDAETRVCGHGIPDMMIGPVVGSFLAFLVRMKQPRRVLEIGTFTGWSSIAMAQALPPGATLVSLDVNEETTALARRFAEEAGVADRIDYRLGQALELLQEVEDRWISSSSTHGRATTPRTTRPCCRSLPRTASSSATTRCRG